MNWKSGRANKIIELYFSGESGTPLRECDLTLDGYLIIDDDWGFSPSTFGFFNERTQKEHKVIEMKIYQRTIYRNIPYSGGCIHGSPHKFDYLLVKCEYQEECNVGDKIFFITRT